MSTGRVWKRGRKWWIQYNVDGRQYRESAKTTRKEQAEALLRERQREIWEGRFFPGARKRAQKSIGELRDAFLKAKGGKRSIDSDKQRIGAFVDHVGDHRPCVSVTGEDVGNFIATLEGHKPATRNRHRAALRTMFNWATKNDIAHRDPMRAIEMEPERNARNRICSPEEYDTLCGLAGLEMRAAITIGYWLGMREGEIAALNSSKLSVKAAELRLAGEHTKESTIKTLPLSERITDAVKALPARIDGNLFSFTKGYVISQRFAKLCESAKIADLTFHDLRHTALTRLGAAGVDIRTIMAISGHKTMVTVMRYVHANPERLREALSQAEAHASRSEASKR